MANEFVNYLNSMNNASSSNINSLAESQVLSNYYHEIQVTRNIGTYISEQIKQNRNECFILTGHAGDGKTSILVQVLRELGLLEKGKKLEDRKRIKENDIELLYVKDMSELNKEQQVKYLEEALKCPEVNASSILITNTGPLLNTFKALFNNDIDIENIILNQLDSNKNDYLEIKGFRFKLINIARVDNVCFSKQILYKLVKEDLWSQCKGCDHTEYCHICTNYNCVNNNFDRVSNFIEAYYRYLYENDKRVTIRQIVSQLSFAFTGNVSCKEIQKRKDKNIKFAYNFANLFFGFRGTHEIDNSDQIKAIKELKALNIDSKSLDEDYNMIVRHDFSCFNEDIRDIIQTKWEDFSKRYKKDISDSNDFLLNNNTEEDINMRKALRRFYIMYSNVNDEEDFDNKISQIFGKVFPIYNRGIINKYSKNDIKALKDLVHRAIYINNVGVPPKGNKDDIYLTLKRNDGSFQNVFLEIGRVRKRDIDIVQESVASEFDDMEYKNELFIMLDRDEDYMFPMTLPILNYFNSISEGAIVTNVNPILGHGIARLNAMLLEKFNSSNDGELLDNECRLIINTASETIGVKVEIDNKTLYIE